MTDGIAAASTLDASRAVKRSARLSFLLPAASSVFHLCFICGSFLPLPAWAADEVPNSSLYSGRLASLRQDAPPAAVSNGLASSAAPPPPAPTPTTWYQVPLVPPKEVRVNDIITIRVDMGARFSSDAQLQRRRTAQYDARLNDWIVLEGLRAMKPAPQTEGDQRVQGNLNQLNRVTGQLDTTESLKFDISATVAAVLPNGNIVLEAHQNVENNNERWLHSLSGVCRREDIGPGNIVLSKHIANLSVKKQEMGHIRDSYKRGWLSRWWDQFGPF
jgi:flagellar L-ring protein precursor FlgH